MSSDPPDSEGPPEGDQPGHQKRRIGTGPLNPDRLRPRKRPTAEERPPATVLQQPEGAPPDLPDEAIRSTTERVRLVPRLPDPPPWRIIFQVQHPVRATIGLDVRDSLVLGRRDPVLSLGADLDLTPYLAAEYGVSRQHAALIPAPEALYLLDLESTNGTWVNGGYLKPGHRYALAPGDTLELGLMKLQVRSVTLLSRS